MLKRIEKTKAKVNIHAPLMKDAPPIRFDNIQVEKKLKGIVIRSSTLEMTNNVINCFFLIIIICIFVYHMIVDAETFVGNNIKLNLTITPLP